MLPDRTVPAGGRSGPRRLIAPTAPPSAIHRPDLECCAPGTLDQNLRSLLPPAAVSVLSEGRSALLPDVRSTPGRWTALTSWGRLSTTLRALRRCSPFTISHPCKPKPKAL